jgi:hypothetical protein
MTTRKEVIAQIDAELSRLERVRDLLVAALKDSRNGSRFVLPLKVKAQAKAPVKKRKRVAVESTSAKSAASPKTVVPAKSSAPTKSAASAKSPTLTKNKAKTLNKVAVAPPPAPPVKVEPEIKRIPPRRRMERRHVQTDKLGKSAAALSGAVPAGPVAVSADEARKMQERASQAVASPVIAEVRPENPGERTLGSLIQAFERRSGLNGLETS